MQKTNLRCAEPTRAGDPVPNAPSVSTPYLPRPATAGTTGLRVTTAAANAAETTLCHLLDSVLVSLIQFQ